MKRFLITSEKFDGEVEVVYSDGKFVRIDFLGARIDDYPRSWFLGHIPVCESGLPAFIASANTLVLVQSDYEVSLDDFKREYPYQRNMHLLPAIWDKMSKTDQVLAVNAAKPYRRYAERQKAKGFDYTPKIAAAWLKAKEYLNNWDKL